MAHRRLTCRRSSPNLINQQNGLAKAKPFEHAQQNVNLTVPQRDGRAAQIEPPGTPLARRERQGFATAAGQVHISDS
jgi:hypothetical protein